MILLSNKARILSGSSAADHSNRILWKVMARVPSGHNKKLMTSGAIEYHNGMYTVMARSRNALSAHNNDL